MSTKNNHQDENQYGVLLYYKYATIPDLNSLFDFYDSNCKSLGLLGRVRLASHGVNVTVCTPLPSLFLCFSYSGYLSILYIDLKFEANVGNEASYVYDFFRSV